MTDVPDDRRAGEIFYYVHHHGGGHRSRAREILRHLEADVVLLSSLSRPPDLDAWVPTGSTARRDWLELAWDTGDGTDPAAAAHYYDADAGGLLHWAPIGHPGLQLRHQQLTAAIAERSPALLVSDVSAEIAGVARLSGVPVVSVLLPGRRDDAPHRLAFDLSRGLLAPWPRPPTAPEWLRPWASRTFHAGGIGAALAATARPTAEQVARRMVIPAFGTDPAPQQHWRAAASASRTWNWELDAELLPVQEWRRRLAAADVVVAHAGLGTIADLAATGRRSVIIPQSRPFGEQDATAELVRSLGIGSLVLPDWPTVGDWDALLDKVSAGPADDWSAWGVQDGARRAAEWLLEQAT